MRWHRVIFNMQEEWLGLVNKMGMVQNKLIKNLIYIYSNFISEWKR